MTEKDGDNNKKPAEALTDAELIGMLERRDENAIRGLEARFGARCRSVAYGILGNAEDAEECVNDVMLKLWNNIPPEKPVDLTAFVTAVTKNAAIDRYKVQRRKNRIPPEKMEPLESAENVGVRDVDPTDKEAVAMLIARYLRGVTPEKRKFFVARYRYGMSEAEIALKTGTPKGTVSGALSRMRKELGRFLEKEGIRI